MTTLKKSIKRELAVPSISKPVIIEIDPETKRIGFHEKGCRRIYWLPILTAFTMAIQIARGGEAHTKLKGRKKESAKGAGDPAPFAGTETTD